MPKVQIFNDADVARIKGMYEEEGRSSSEIARIMHCFPTTIRRYLHREGVELRPRGGGGVEPLRNVSHKDMELIRFLYCYREWTIKMIAAHLGLTPAMVRYRMIRGGIARRNRSEAGRVAFRNGRMWHQRDKRLQTTMEDARADREIRQESRPRIPEIAA